jgi:hypothetical protein
MGIAAEDPFKNRASRRTYLSALAKVSDAELMQ